VFINPTVFQLGAGASWHYGYPTGEELVKEVEAVARELRDFCDRSRHSSSLPNFVRQKMEGNPITSGSMQKAWEDTVKESDELAVRLQRVNPLVIDYFLGLNRHLEDIGKLIIAFVMLRCQAVHLAGRGNINRQKILESLPLKRDRLESKTVDVSFYKDDWYRLGEYHLSLGSGI
jgi:hypothetical protein